MAPWGVLKSWLAKMAEKTDWENKDFIYTLLEENPDAKLLDCGCNDGFMTKAWGDRIGTSHLYGVEVVLSLAEEAQRRGIKVCSTDLNAPLPFDSEMFDALISNQVIEHLHNTDTFVREVWRVLKPEGYAIVSTINLASWHNIITLILGFQPFSAWVSDEVTVGTLTSPRRGTKPAGAMLPAQAHLRLFTRGALKGLFEHHGFSVELVRGVGYYPFIGSMARFMSRADGKHSVLLTMKVRKSK